MEKPTFATIDLSQRAVNNLVSLLAVRPASPTDVTLLQLTFKTRYAGRY